MPARGAISGQDWAPVNAGRGSLTGGAGGVKAVPKSARDVSMLKAAGVITTEKKFGAGGNKSAHTSTALSAKKLEDADDVGTLAKVDRSLSKAIQQVRSFSKNQPTNQKVIF